MSRLASIVFGCALASAPVGIARAADAAAGVDAGSARSGLAGEGAERAAAGVDAGFADGLAASMWRGLGSEGVERAAAGVDAGFAGRLVASTRGGRAERAAAEPVGRFIAQVRGLAGDVETGPLTNDTHYFASNERDLDLIAGSVQDVGGVVVAVGADPGYLLAAWADAEALVLIDLDPAIVRLHHIYLALFAAAAGPEEFRRLWSAAGREEAREIVGASARDDERAALLEVFEAAQPAVERRLSELERRMAAAGQAWLLSDARLYARVAGLVRAGKVVALRGDFTRAGVVHDVGAALRAAGLRVGLLYLSNIEQYFLYTPGFRANVAALPLAGGQVLRTLPGRPAGFEYILQQGGHFQSWAARPTVRSVYRIRGFKKGEHLTSRRVHVVDPGRAPP